MTDEQINVAIAKARGVMKWSYALPKRVPACGLADCCNDLNAIHEAVNTLNRNERHEWLVNLDEITKRDAQRIGLSDGFSTRIANATARQRAEAFLRTLGKWND